MLLIPVDFYPRSPRGERPDYYKELPVLSSISIHAPREGSDPLDAWHYADYYISIHAPREGSDMLIIL